MAITADDPHFRQFAVSLEKAIARYDEPDDEDFLARQKRQVDTLVLLERQFKRALIRHAYGPGVYKAFVRHICDERRNILDARPFFRERQGVFTQRISAALRRRSIHQLHRFNFNYRFVKFVLGARKWHQGSIIVKLGAQIRAVREELVTMNMPLAISRARIFYSRTPKAHLTYMDFIQIAAEGLMSGIDKFVPPFSRAFRSVAIGRMTGNFIEAYSETPVHFYPVDKRKIYRANKLVGKTTGPLDFEVVAKVVNEGVEAGHRTTPAEIADLMAAASTVSSDAPVESTESGEPQTTLADRLAAPSASQPDIAVEEADAMRNLGGAFTALTVFERKLLRLRGVQL